MTGKLIFFGGVGTSTGANIMLEHDERKLLVDCGMVQGSKFVENKNYEPFGYDPKKVEVLIITHAHLDHIGRVPKLVREGFRGRIVSTKETMDLAEPMLFDALKVLQIKHPEKILFEKGDVEKTLSLWEGHDYGQKVELFDNCSLKMLDAGHILGSAICVLELISPDFPPESPFRRAGVSTPFILKGEPKKIIKIAFTGDLGNSPSVLLPDTQIPEGIDYLVMESVYGDRNHENKKERRERLKELILEGINRGGTIVIPVFSVERTQVLLYELNNMIEDGEIPQILVFLDSPLAQKVTHIYKKYKADFKESVRREIRKGDDIFDFPGLKIVKNAEESAEIEKIKGPKIILAGSGMSEGGRIVNHEARILDKAENTLILVGYQAVGTLGRRLQDGAKEIELRSMNHESMGRQKVKVRATIENITGYSSHKDSEHLLEFVERSTATGDGERSRTMKLKRVFVIMGEPHASLFLTQRIRDYLNIDALYPEEGKEYEIF